VKKVARRSLSVAEDVVCLYASYLKLSKQTKEEGIGLSATSAEIKQPAWNLTAATLQRKETVVSPDFIHEIVTMIDPGIMKRCEASL